MSLVQRIKVDNDYEINCSTAIHESLSESHITKVIIDLIINHLFAKYTVYALEEEISNSVITLDGENSTLTVINYQYKKLNNLCNTNDLYFYNQHIFMKNYNSLYVLPENDSKTIKIKHPKHISNSYFDKSDEFLVCEGHYSYTELDLTYLYNNSDGKFYCYDHTEKQLLSINQNGFRKPPFPLKKVVRNLNSHGILYYWCLMTNGVLFKIVIDQYYFGRHLRDAIINPSQHFVSEFGPPTYEEAIKCGRHTIDLEVFRLIPQEIPKIINMVSGSDHLLFIDDEYRLWVYGNNEFGQCAIKKSTDVIIQPIKHRLFKHIQIVKLFAGKNRSLLIDNNGICYIFGLGINDITVQKPYKTIQQYHGFKEHKIITAACGDDHFIFINSKCEVYGLGSNREGQISSNLNIEYYDEPHLISPQYIGINSKSEKITKVIVNKNSNYFVSSSATKQLYPKDDSFA